MREEDGAATVLGAALVVIVVLIAMVVVTYASAVGARHHAQAAADSAAISGATALAWLTDAACEQAEIVAQRNRAEMIDCEVIDSDVVVSVRVALPVSVPGWTGVKASARAGPQRAEP